MAIPAQFENQLELPIIGAPLFIISTPDLVIAQCKAGIAGSFPALNARPQPELSTWLTRIEDELAAHKEENPNAVIAPYGVNQIVHHSNDRLDADFETIIEHKVPLIITSLGVPEKKYIDRIHEYGGIIMSDVISVRHAKKVISAGVDGLILVCAGAGGHAGTLSPFALVSEVREFFDGPLALSGSIANGQSILSTQALGADFAYLGTAFIATTEANADQGYKDSLVECAASDIVYSSLFTGVLGNYLKPSVKNAGLDPDNLPEADKTKMNFGSGGNTGAKAWKDIWGAGQGTGSIHAVESVADVMARFKREYTGALDNLKHVVRD
ncbi:2-nitropropane dioxygenase [Gammaproteobacteria bacterium 45_16_T64]|nr:2-nitropropane dioxygenase [Gammaproteobacteria bacterium 45_16_T64]